MRRRRRPLLTDEQLLGREADMLLLADVSEGRVTRPGTGIMAGYLLGDEQIGRLSLAGLADQELISLPISGPPRIEPRGERLLAILRPSGRT